MKAFNEFRTWALVTGAASGMGRIYSQRLAQMGYNIIMVDINAAGLQETESIVKAEVEAARTLAIVQDLSVADAADKIFEVTEKAGCVVEVLVNNAGVTKKSPFLETPEEMFDLAQRVMLYAKSDFPDLKIYLCGLNLFKDKRETSAEYDSWLRAFAAEVPDCTYVDISGYEPLHRTDIFAEDNKHFNHEGYRIYGELFKEVLKEELDQF